MTDIQIFRDVVKQATDAANELCKLTGEHDPLLNGVVMVYANGKTQTLGNVRLSEIGGVILRLEK